MAEPITLVCPRCEATNRLPAARLSAGPRCGACHRPLFDGQPVALTDAGFRRHLAQDAVPLLVDFWAEWCGPCHAMAPQFAAAARDLEPGFRLAKVSTEAAPRLAEELRITGIPLLVLFRGGLEVARKPGAMAARDIIAWARAAAA